MFGTSIVCILLNINSKKSALKSTHNHYPEEYNNNYNYNKQMYLNKLASVDSVGVNIHVKDPKNAILRSKNDSINTSNVDQVHIESIKQDLKEEDNINYKSNKSNKSKAKLTKVDQFTDNSESNSDIPQTNDNSNEKSGKHIAIVYNHTDQTPVGVEGQQIG